MQSAVEGRIDCPYFITQIRWDLMGTDFVKAYPVLTFKQWPDKFDARCLLFDWRGERTVIDVGGTSTDVGAFDHDPRPASTTVDVGGVRTNFRMPDVFSIALVVLSLRPQEWRNHPGWPSVCRL